MDTTAKRGPFWFLLQLSANFVWEALCLEAIYTRGPTHRLWPVSLVAFVLVTANTAIGILSLKK